jgi:hypothetical protein
MKILSISLFYLCIIFALSLGLLYVLLQRRVKSKTSIVDIHKILHEYIYANYIYLIFQLKSNKKVDRERIQKIFAQEFDVLSLSENLSKFVRCDQVIQNIRDSKDTKNPYLLPDTFVRRNGNDYYLKLLTAVSRNLYDTNVFETMSNKDAKQYLQYFY